MSGRAPSDIELAQIKQLCLKLYSAVEGYTPEVVLCAIEIFVASVLVDADVPVRKLLDGVGEVVDRMKATKAMS